MFKFSCFSNQAHHHQPKVFQSMSAAMHRISRNSQDEVSSSNPKTADNNLSTVSVQQNVSPCEDCSRSEDFNAYAYPDNNEELPLMVSLKKSQSLGNMLEKEKHYTFDNTSDVHGQDGGAGECRTGNSVGLYDENKVNPVASSFCFTDPASNEVLFSAGTSELLNEKQHDGAVDLSADHLVNSELPLSCPLLMISRSQSVGHEMNNSDGLEGTSDPGCLGPRSRSFDDLCSAGSYKGDDVHGDDTFHSERTSQSKPAASHQGSDLEGVSSHHADASEEQCVRSNISGGYNEVEGKDINRKYCIANSGHENHSKDGVSPCYADSGDDCHHSKSSGGLNAMTGFARKDKHLAEVVTHDNLSLDICNSKDNWHEVDQRDSEIDDEKFAQKLQHEFYYQNCNELSPEEFNIRRIEDWVNQIDIQNDMIVEEQIECSNAASKRDTTPGASGPKLDTRSPIGMEMAYSYIATLNPVTSSAQLSNLGLVAIPILSAFAGLRLLNLSGNSIVRITSGALPKGLHMLNLSKNNISAIEGLRELTRLRVLDLSYNRIAKIGHGLASCSSLKELYLAGNKISEVEGLHRLLKLKILDLRFNKISTSKGLGQLAANYSSLEAINLEGNPAQKNVGDEQLKKYLLSLLPHLVYYNKQTTRAKGTKEVSDRHTRVVSSLRADRGKRPELKPSRRPVGGAAAQKSSSSHRARAVPGLLRPSKSRNASLVPDLFKPDHLPNGGKKLFGMEISNPIRRIRSEGKF